MSMKILLVHSMSAMIGVMLFLGHQRHNITSRHQVKVKMYLNFTKIINQTLGISNFVIQVLRNLPCY